MIAQDEKLNLLHPGAVRESRGLLGMRARIEQAPKNSRDSQVSL